MLFVLKMRAVERNKEQVQCCHFIFDVLPCFLKQLCLHPLRSDEKKKKRMAPSLWPEKQISSCRDSNYTTTDSVWAKFCRLGYFFEAKSYLFQSSPKMMSFLATSYLRNFLHVDLNKQFQSMF
jgi:hypothetical protein